MKSHEFRRLLASGKRLFFDGGLGTMLQARGLPSGVSPEEFCIDHPNVLKRVHADYAKAGADILTTNTFGGTCFKLPPDLDVRPFNARMAALARDAAEESGRQVFVAGSVGPTGKFLAPLGDVSFNELKDAFAEQIRGLAEGGADLIQIETQIDIAEARAAVIAARSVCDLPISVSMTYENGVTLTGSTPEVCAATLANLGVDIIGTNCSAGPEELRDVVERLLSVSPLPVLVQPNAGLPELVNGATVFPLGAERFAELTGRFAMAGAQLVGGCCGTTPDHIGSLRAMIEREHAVLPPQVAEAGCISLTSRSELVRIGEGEALCLIGERINPTGKKTLSAELVQGAFSTALRFAEEQLAVGARVLDVNVGAPMVDEMTVLPELVSLLSSRHNAPLSIDSPNADAVSAALQVYPASPLLNSISGEPGRMEKLGPLCRNYGAPFILLPLKGSALPVKAEARIAILEELLEEMTRMRIPHRLAIVDALVLSVSAKSEAAAECLKFIRYCRERGFPTTAGLSNVSFGLPARDLVNSVFLSMAAGAGLSSCIANPGNARLRESAAASRLLLGQDPDATAFIRDYSDWSSGSGSTQGGGSSARQTTSSPQAQAGPLTLYDAVIRGMREEAVPLTRQELDKGHEPFALVNEQLIPAITEVGNKYERKEYFLPQLLRSAETMQAAFAILKPLLQVDAGKAASRKVVMATVEGDIHDIGKNIVNLMLGNHGFEVVDLGKDVKAEVIVEQAIQHGAKLIGLSALMTTTMVRMKDTVDLLKAMGRDDVKVFVGGAVVTEAFADAIGADGYAADAVEAVRLASRLL